MTETKRSNEYVQFFSLTSCKTITFKAETETKSYATDQLRL